MSKIEDQLASLHTAAIDARNGYQEAIEQAEGHGLTSLFQELASLHERHATELGALLTKRDQNLNTDGSFMSVVHETIMDVRGLVGGLGKSVLPGLIDGEKRNRKKYDDVLQEPVNATDEPILGRQRGELEQVIQRMEAMKEPDR